MAVIVKDWKGQPDETKVCYCNEVTLGEIRQAIVDGAESLEDLQEATGACTGNMCEEKNPSGVCCETDIRKILALHGKQDAPGPGGSCKCCG